MMQLPRLRRSPDRRLRLLGGGRNGPNLGKSGCPKSVSARCVIKITLEMPSSASTAARVSLRVDFGMAEFLHRLDEQSKIHSASTTAYAGGQL
jgi:hypothetical protein